eukprot:CAMPEP_0197077014 /NCGR_PEP_ID=MMETSP1384-20130603/212405_1 /TAXON_ID=29189 /ORGANISM="Ammonia sp." /LENGTH=871 /DNA_ID=CAMNT_0042515873 /DNA_START=97 /DNA_END=2712 /DNA_ORIENTATION=+
MTDIQIRFEELSADLAANRKELSSKTKQLVELQNQLSSMKAELNNKDKQIDELRISSQISSENRFDEMHLQMEEYKNQIQAKESEKQELYSSNMELQRQNQHMKSQLDSLSFKFQHNQNEFNLRLTRLDAMYKQKIESMAKAHQQQIEYHQKKIEAVKQEQFLMSNKETEDIVNSLNDLRTSHDQIESDLNAQIEDLRDQMEKREREKEQLIEEMRALSDQSKTHFEAKIQELTDKLARYEEGDVEIVLKIEVEDPVLHKPPPKKPAPHRPAHMMQHSQPVPTSHSRNSSGASSNHSYNPSGGALLSPVDSSGPNNMHLTLQNVRSNPEFWAIDHSDPNAPHHQPQRSMPLLLDSEHVHQGSNDELPDDDEDGEQDTDDRLADDKLDADDDSKDSKSDDNEQASNGNGGGSSNHYLLYPTISLTETKSDGHVRNASNTSNKSATQYISQRSKNKGRRRSAQLKASKSASSIQPVVPSSGAPARPRTPTFYIFRTASTNAVNGDKSEEKEDNHHKQSYNASKSSESGVSSSHKYTDSAIGIIKSMWGTTPKPQSPNPNRRWRGMSSARSVGYPATPQPNGHHHHHPKRNASVTSFNSDLFAFSDNLSVTSSGYGDQPAPSPPSNASGGKPSETDLANKSLTLQLEMHKQASTRLAEDLKNANKKVMVIKQQAHRKIKQIQLTLQAEQRKWKLREKELSDKLEKKAQDTKRNEMKINQLQQKFQALRADYSLKLQQQQQNGNTPQNPAANANTNALVSQVQSLEQNNAALAQENDKYRRDLSGLKQTILSCNDTMKQQQQQILILNTQLAELRKLNGFGGSSSEELLGKQIRLLKSQRRMLVKELKDLREQNDKLKNIIVTGATPSSVKPYNM